MLKQVLNFSFLIVLFSLVVLTSCKNDSSDDVSIDQTIDELLEDADTDVYTAIVMFNLQEGASVGPYGCFELVFPITIEFPDSTTAEVNDYDELKAEIIAWKDANPDATDRPNFAYPFEVISADGELITITSKSELRDLKKDCKGNFPSHGHDKHGKCSDPCFDIVFPLTVAFPDGTTTEVADRAELKTTIRDWKEANPDATEKPEVVFPIQVEMETDSTIVTVNDKDELKTLKESCQD